MSQFGVYTISADDEDDDSDDKEKEKPKTKAPTKKKTPKKAPKEKDGTFQIHGLLDKYIYVRSLVYLIIQTTPIQTMRRRRKSPKRRHLPRKRHPRK